MEGLFQLRLEGSPTENVYIAYVGVSDGEDDYREGNLFVRDVVVRIRDENDEEFGIDKDFESLEDVSYRPLACVARYGACGGTARASRC